MVVSMVVVVAIGVVVVDGVVDIKAEVVVMEAGCRHIAESVDVQDMSYHRPVR